MFTIRLGRGGYEQGSYGHLKAEVLLRVRITCEALKKLYTGWVASESELFKLLDIVFSL